MRIYNNKVAVVTDLHIGIHQDSPMWHDVCLNFAEWFKVQLNKRGINDIIICGDINNDRNEISLNSLNVLTRVFTIWKEFNIIVIVGNHDSYYRDKPDINSLSVLSGWSNITIIDKIQSINAFNKNLTFCPWGVNMDDIAKSDILFGHFEIMGFSMSKNKVCDSGFVYNNILEKAPLVMSGHFHMREVRKYDENKQIVYVGSPYEQNWGDYGSDDRGFYILDINDSTFEFIKNEVSPKHKKIRFSELYAAGGMTEDIKKEFKNNYVNIIIDQDFKTDVIEKLIPILNTYGPKLLKVDYLLENRFNTTTGIDFENIDIPVIIEEFVKTLEKEDEYKDDILKTTLEIYEECTK